MTTDLRAALRAACKKLHGLTPHASADENAEIGAWQDLADAPPTVAELLAALPSPSPHGRTFVEWTEGGLRCRASIVGLGGLFVEALRDDARWYPTTLSRHDLTQPARLVEVA